jgi:hypothetical protein
VCCPTAHSPANSSRILGIDLSRRPEGKVRDPVRQTVPTCALELNAQARGRTTRDGAGAAGSAARTRAARPGEARPLT